MGKRSIGLIKILGPQGHNRKALGMGLLVISIAVSILVGACMDVQVRMGRRTDPGALDKTLRIKESTSTEVLAALGEPFGKGKALLPIAHQTPRTMWTYYYGEANMKDGQGMYLFVFLDQDRYDGYMWFSSLPK